MEFTGLPQGVIDGARVLVQSALAPAVAVATSLVLARMRLGPLAGCALLYSVSAVAAGALAPPVPVDVVASSVLFIFGVLVATGVRLQRWSACVAIIAGGVASGLAGKMQTASGAESAGGAVALFLLVLVAGMVTRVPAPARLQRAAGLGRRMAGAWLAAVGVLMIALSMRGAS